MRLEWIAVGLIQDVGKKSIQAHVQAAWLSAKKIGFVAQQACQGIQNRLAPGVGTLRICAGKPSGPSAAATSGATGTAPGHACPRAGDTDIGSDRSDTISRPIRSK